MALEALTAAITANATVGADLTEVSVARSTKQVAEVLYKESTPTIKLRSTKQAAEVLYKETTPTIKLRSTKQIVEVLYTENYRQLDVAITAEATVAAELYENLVLRTTSQVVQVLQNNDPNLRTTSQVVQVLQNNDPNLRTTSQVVQVLYVEHVIGAQPLTASISATGDSSADIANPKFLADCNAEALVTAIITGTWQFSSDVTCGAVVTAELDVKVKLTSTITATGDVVADIRENIEYLDTTISATGDITTAELDVPWHAGNTLNLTHSAAVEKVLARSLEHTLDLQHQVDLTFGQRSLSASSQIIFTHSATVIRVLPTQVASNTITFTQSLSEYREVISYLVLQHEATGTIDFIEGVASSVLNLTDSASAAGTVFNLSVESQLNLTHLVDGDLVAALTAQSDLVLAQNAFAVVLAGKKYVLLQAPFELIQTSVILPNPLLDDNESLVSNLVLRRSMDNTPRTYVQTSDSRRLRYTFIMTRMKALELEGFFKAYNGAYIKMLNWKGEIWKIKLITNPIDFVQTRRAEPGGDRTDVNLEFEGVLLNG